MTRMTPKRLAQQEAYLSTVEVLRAMRDLHPALRKMLDLPPSGRRWPCGCFIWSDGTNVDLCAYHDGYNDARLDADGL